MEVSTTDPADFDEVQPKWQPIGSVERRVLGVLVEKSKTTPDVYPMTVNGIRTACNQKSNRKPLMQLDAEDIEEALNQLRQVGAVSEIHGDGRTTKFKHRLYAWMGVEKIELAVMAELLLRGEQSIGDLRGRASRMEKIADINELKPIISDLINKKLVIALTPPGRGQMVTHNLYLPEQLDKLTKQFESGEQFDSAQPDAQVDKHPSAKSSELQQRVTELESQIERLTREIERINQLLS